MISIGAYPARVSSRTSGTTTRSTATTVQPSASTSVRGAPRGRTPGWAAIASAATAIAARSAANSGAPASAGSQRSRLASSGRWPHIHFEVYPSLDEAASSDNKIATSQLAFPEAVCDTVYATAGYEQSVTNMKRTSLSDDMVFSDDNAVHQMATVTGSVSAGYVATLNVPV